MCVAGFLISSRYFLFGIELFSHFVFLIAIVCFGSFLFWEWKIVLPSSTMFAGWLLGAIGGTHYEKVTRPIKLSLSWILMKSRMVKRTVRKIRMSLAARAHSWRRVAGKS
jgi:hypothetical protein